MASSALRKNAGIDSSGAVPDAIALHSELIEQREMKVRQWHVFEANVPSALQIARAPTRQNKRNIQRRMRVAVRDARAEDHRHVVEQRAVSVPRRLQLFEQRSEHFHVIGVDLR